GSAVLEALDVDESTSQGEGRSVPRRLWAYERRSLAAGGANVAGNAKCARPHHRPAQMVLEGRPHSPPFLGTVAAGCIHDRPCACCGVAVRPEHTDGAVAGNGAKRRDIRHDGNDTARAGFDQRIARAFVGAAQDEQIGCAVKRGHLIMWNTAY